MAITRTGVVISTNTTFGDSDDMDFYINGGQLGINQVPVSGLTPDTVYYAKGYVQQDGTTITDPSYKAFRTGSYIFFHFNNETSGQNTIRLVKRGSPADITLEYSTDVSNWTSWSSANGDLSVTIGENETVWFRGDNSTFSTSASNYYSFSSTGNLTAGGNLMTLIDSTGETEIIPCSYCFTRLFYNMTGLLDAVDMDLGAKGHLPFSYEYMFYGCTSMTTPPKEIYCNATGANGESICHGMFYGCRSLITPPVIYLGHITFNLFYEMFYNCRSLSETAEIVSIGTGFTGSGGVDDSMYYGCTSLKATAEYVYDGTRMYYGCTGITTVNTVFSSTKSYASREMFRGCTSLKRIDLSAITRITTGTQGLANMLRGCSQLSEIIAPTVSTWDTTKFGNWVDGVAATGDFYHSSGVTIPTGANGIPSGWTEHTI